MTQLIIIRGNSGSGKSSVGKTVRPLLGNKTALIEQDYFRRTILKEKDRTQDTDIVEFLYQSTQFAAGRGYTVILEGIMYSRKYREMLLQLTHEFKALAFYLDVSFEETLQRHDTKPNRDEFGYAEMKDWYVPNDCLRIPGEVIIPETSSLNNTVSLVVGAYHASKADT